MNKVYDIITDRIVKLLEQGTVPWHKPWTSGLPKNLVSKKEYRGVNVFMLHATGYSAPWWVSYKQATALGGQVKKGEKGFPCIFWNWMEKEDKDTEKLKKFPLLRYYTVFNVEQCDGVKFPAPVNVTREFTPIEACEKALARMQREVKVHHGSGRAYYAPQMDSVTMPEKVKFDKPEDYYSVLFHEFTHATGHKSRLDRATLQESVHFGSTNYSKEELVAEMGAAYMASHTGIEQQTIDNSVSYIANWLQKLRNDKALVVQAAAAAQKAVDYMLERKWDTKTEETQGGPNS